MFEFINVVFGRQIRMWKVHFHLANPAPVSIDYEIYNTNVSVIENSSEISVSNVQAVNQVDAQIKGLKAAISCLAFLCWKQEIVLHINLGRWSIEELDSRGTVTKCTGNASIQLDIILVDGNKPQMLGTVKGKESEGASYYRKGCLSTDTFDQFRNFYLVAENISSHIALKKGLGRLTEQPLLQAGLTECFHRQENSLTEAAKKTPGFNPNEPVLEEVARYLYRGQRCQLNHSKAGQVKKVPFDPQDEKEVTDALPLMKFVAKTLLEYEESSL
jgi:hypothetical protein